MPRDFSVPLSFQNVEEWHYRLDNDPDEDGNPKPERLHVTGSDRTGIASRMAVHGKMPTVIHGLEKPGSKIPFTLVIFEWSTWTESIRTDKRFRRVTIEVAFSAHGSRRSAEPEAQRLRQNGSVARTGPSSTAYWDPMISAISPEFTSFYHPTINSVSSSSTLGVSLQATPFPGVSFGPNQAWTRTAATNRTETIEISGSRATVGEGHSGTRPNAVRWVMLENPSQSTGVPTYLKTAVLLERRPNDNGKFLATVKVSYHVSAFHDLRESLLKAAGKIPVDAPIVFDPEPGWGKKSAGKSNKAPTARLSSSSSSGAGGDGGGEIDRTRLADYASHLSREFQLATLEPLPESKAAPHNAGGNSDDAQETAADGGVKVEISPGEGEEGG